MKKLTSKLTAYHSATINFSLFILLLCNTIVVQSQVGIFDVTFGDGGKVVTDIGNKGADNAEVALQKDGKIILLTYGSFGDKMITGGGDPTFALVRYTKEGLIDYSFGRGGVVQDYTSTRYSRHLTMALQGDEKIIVSGNDAYHQGPGFSVTRFDNSGKVDSSFGIDGSAVTNFGGYYEFVSKVAIKGNGKILVAGTSDSRFGQLKCCIAQFNSNGTLDTTFGFKGKAKLDLLGLVSYYRVRMSPQADGKIVLAYEASIQQKTTIIITRLNADGSVDSKFGTNGFFEIPLNYPKITGLSLTQSGEILLLANSHPRWESYLFKLNNNGFLDSTFGGNGRVAILPGEDSTYCTDAKIQPNGKIMVCGFKSYDPQTFFNGDPNSLLLKYNENGSPDSTFGKHGVIITDIGRKPNGAFSFIVQPNGKILLAGASFYIDNDGYRATNSILLKYEDTRLYYNTINGYVYFDYNRNGIKDTGEPLATNASLVATTGIDSFSVYSSNGKFSVDVDSGTYITKVNPYHPYYRAVPARFVTRDTTYFNTDTIIFGLQPIPNKRDVKVNLIPLTPARPGFNATYKIVYSNVGTDTISSGTIYLIKNSKENFISASPAVTFIRDDTLRWSYSNLKPTETASIAVNMKVQPPPTANRGDALILIASIFPNTTDITPYDNTSVCTQNVVGSYDPNDKTESHAGKLKVSQVQQGDELQYTIRFQNTGTDTAFNVYIRDTLSNKVDWSTLKMIASSHNFQLTMNDGNKCSWAFNNINLVDSNTNERLSHGYLVYSVKAKKTLFTGQSIDNTAHIYFDYNLPVSTNTERTAIVNTTLPIKLVSFTVERLGKNNEIQWLTDKEINLDRFEVERSQNATIFSKIGTVKAGLNNYSFSDYTPAKTINYYRLKMIDKDGKYEYSPVRTIDNTGVFYVSTYPNPVTKQLTVQVESEKETSIYLQIVGMDGKLVMIKQKVVPSGMSLQTVDLSDLQSGNYFLKIATDAQNQIVTKLQKL